VSNSGLEYANHIAFIRTIRLKIVDRRVAFTSKVLHHNVVTYIALFAMYSSELTINSMSQARHTQT